MAKKARRTTHRSRKGKKLYAKRTKSGKFKDIQSYKRAHGKDVKRKAKGEKRKTKKKAVKKTRKATRAVKRTVKRAVKRVSKAAKKVVRRAPKKVVRRAPKKAPAPAAVDTGMTAAPAMTPPAVPLTSM